MIDALDGIFRSLDKPSAEGIAELQRLMPFCELRKQVLLDAHGVCSMCGKSVGLVRLTVKVMKDTGQAEALCRVCALVSNWDSWIADYWRAAARVWADRIAYQAQDRLKTERIRKQSRAAKAKKSRAIKLAADKAFTGHAEGRLTLTM